MNTNRLLPLLLFLSCQLMAQESTFHFTKLQVEAQLKHIASDQMGGRRTGSVGEKMAADYIASQFAEFGLKPPVNQAGFFQKVPFVKIQPPKSALLEIGENLFLQGDNLLVIKGGEIDTKTEVVFAGNGWVDEAKGINDYKDLDVNNKIVVVVTGTQEGGGPAEVFDAMGRKQELARAHGAIALIEIYKVQLPWAFSKSYFGKERMELKQSEGEKNNFIYAWIQEKGDGLATQLSASRKVGRLKIEEGQSQLLDGYNVVGIVEGTDPDLKNEYLLLSAHYDHMGVGKEGGAAYSPKDSIFNGARDNGIGTVALLAAAKDLAANPPKRSVLVLACTAEEMGMLGSAWYASHPLVPLEQTIFNLNTDGAGYNSTGHVNLIGKELTNATEEITKASEAVGLELLDDPAPDQNLYERSDNISFAKKGIPAVDFAPGITAMDESVFKYYHQATDNPDSIDYDYLLKFCQAYALAARLIADKGEKLQWKGDNVPYGRR